MAIVDPDAFQDDKFTYLSALYDLLVEDANDGNILMMGIQAEEVAKRCEFSKSKSERIFMDLREEGLIKFWSTGPVIGLTKEGRDHVEAEKFKRSTKGRIRAAKKTATEKAKDAAAKLGIYAFGLLTPTLLSFSKKIMDAILSYFGISHG